MIGLGGRKIIRLGLGALVGVLDVGLEEVLAIVGGGIDIFFFGGELRWFGDGRFHDIEHEGGLGETL